MSVIFHLNNEKLGIPGAVDEGLVCPQKPDVVLIQGRHEVLMVDDLVHIPNVSHIVACW